MVSSPTPSSDIVVELFGGLVVRRGGTSVSRFPTRKTAALLAYLAYFGKREHPREELVELLWPESDLQGGRKSLSVALSAVRRLLGQEETAEGPLVSDRFTVRLSAKFVRTDVAAFEGLLRAGRETPPGPDRERHLCAALDLYRGRLLPGHYEDWVTREQERLSGLLAEAVSLLNRTLERSGRPEQGVPYIQHALDLDPLREELHLELMRAYVASGQYAAVLRHFQELERLFQRELDTTPSPSVREFVEQVRKNVVGKAPSTVPNAPPSSPPTGSSPPRNSLPGHWNSFVGREKEKQQVQELFGGGARLVTLTGFGGTGKTRLATEAAAELAARSGGALWFVPLADLSDVGAFPERVMGVVAGAGREGGTTLDVLIEVLREQPGLLILDNFEHLLKAAPLVAALLQGAPECACLVTSRHRLGIPGGHELTLLPLPVPPADELYQSLTGCASVRLFLDRAQAARAGFELTPENMGAVVSLCRRLEGIPLALELAAARISVLTPAQILKQLEAGTPLLAARQAPEARHGSLEATVEWSYRLLNPELQTFFARLSVFRGGWSLPACTAICDAAERTVEFLTDLRDSSLILAEESGGEMRYRMLETVRTFAARHLPESERFPLRRRHRDWFLAFARERSPAPIRQPDWWVGLEQEHGNLTAALAWSRAEPGEAVPGLRLAATLATFWRIRGYTLQGFRHLQDLLARPETQQPEGWRIGALNAAGGLAAALEEERLALEYFEESERISRARGEPRLLSFTLCCLAGMAARCGNRDRARLLYEESLALKTESRDPLGVPGILVSLARLERERGDLAQARSFCEKALLHTADHEDRHCLGMCLEALGWVATAEGDPERARSLHQAALRSRIEMDNQAGIASSFYHLGLLAEKADEARHWLTRALEIRSERGDQVGTVQARVALGRLALREDDLDMALAQFRQALALSRQLPRRNFLKSILEGLAGVAWESGALLRAARLLGASDAAPDTLNDEALGSLPRALPALRAASAGGELKRSWEEGRALAPQQAIAAALETVHCLTGESSTL